VITGFHHPGLVVPDLQAARRFYQQALGFVYIRDYGWDTSMSAEAERVVGVADSTTRCVLMKCGNCFLELFEYLTPTPEGDPMQRRACDYGIAHLAFQVSDPNPPVQIGQYRSIYARDPFGNIIELMQLGSDEPDFDLVASNMLPADSTELAQENES
jgi:catechol 2,3-dioxygenase-like lactoylglutathione lyase family enzyme